MLRERKLYTMYMKTCQVEGRHDKMACTSTQNNTKTRRIPRRNRYSEKNLFCVTVSPILVKALNTIIFKTEMHYNSSASTSALSLVRYEIVNVVFKHDYKL